MIESDFRKNCHIFPLIEKIGVLGKKREIKTQKLNIKIKKYLKKIKKYLTKNEK